MLSKLSPAFPATLLYITSGVLMVIWSVLWFYFYTPDTQFEKFFFTGTMCTGVAFFVIGALLGRIGRAARKAELPPPEVVQDVAEIEKKRPAPSPGSAEAVPPSPPSPEAMPVPEAQPALQAPVVAQIQPTPPQPPTRPAPEIPASPTPHPSPQPSPPSTSPAPQATVKNYAVPTAVVAS